MERLRTSWSLPQVLILSERLHSVTAMFDRMRAAHFEEILQESKPAKREGVPTRVRKSLPRPAPSGPGRGHESNGEVAELREEQVQEYDETRALQVRTFLTTLKLYIAPVQIAFVAFVHLHTLNDKDS